MLLLGQPPYGGAKRSGRIRLSVDGWSITIVALEKCRELSQELRRSGGFAITHVGEIRSCDGQAIASADLEDLLNCLHYFLSFAAGRWTGPALPVGFDAAGNRVFEMWGMPMAAGGAWNGSCSWFDTQHSEFFSQVFPGFLSLWKSSLWREPLTHALYWYIGANDRGVGVGVDTGIVLAQTALEGLAWTYCVQQRKMVSKEAFGRRGLSAANKIRLLTTSLQIPTDIPSHLSALNSKPGSRWEDGIDAITSIRNCLVHADAKNTLPEHSYYEAWRLSQWFIDLVLLRLCGHDGKYANRLEKRWVGSVKAVPWT